MTDYKPSLGEWHASAEYAECSASEITAESYTSFKPDFDALSIPLPIWNIQRAKSMTHATLTGAMNCSAADIEKLEHDADLYLTTLRSFIEAMGGKLELTARFDKQSVHIKEFCHIALYKDPCE